MRMVEVEKHEPWEKYWRVQVLLIRLFLFVVGIPEVT
jgi:hypothetical protein